MLIGETLTLRASLCSEFCVAHVKVSGYRLCDTLSSKVQWLKAWARNQANQGRNLGLAIHKLYDQEQVMYPLYISVLSPGDNTTSFVVKVEKIHRKHVAQCLVQSECSKNGSCCSFSESLPSHVSDLFGLHLDKARQHSDPSN